MTIEQLNRLSLEEVMDMYNLSVAQLDDIRDTTNHILDELENLKRAERNNYATKGYRMKIKNSIDYADLYKAVKSKHYSLWSGLISREAYREYYRCFILDERPKVTAEHYWNRARVVHELIDGNWGDILRKYHAIGFIYIYFENPGIGKFHITTESENSKLSSNQQQNFDLSWIQQYDNVDIELFTGRKDNVSEYPIRSTVPLVGSFDSKPQDFWKYMNVDEMLSDISFHEIDVSDIDDEFDIRII